VALPVYVTVLEAAIWLNRCEW